MKSLFSRFHKNGGAPSGSRPTSAASHKEKGEPLRAAEARAPILPPLQAAHSIPYDDLLPLDPPDGPSANSQSSSSSDSTRPRSAMGQLEGEDIAPLISGPWMEERLRTMSMGEAHTKKVTFRSPAPTPTASVVLDVAPMGSSWQEDMGRRAPSPNKKGTGNRTVNRPPTVQSSRPNAPSPQSSTGSHKLSLNLRKGSLPPWGTSISHPSSQPSSQPNSASPTKSSALSATPSEHSLGSAASAMSYLPPPNSWSEMAEEELIANLGPKERTRQEVLFEIVNSEERYVSELLKLTETFCTALLPPSATSPSLSLEDPSSSLMRSLSPSSPVSTASRELPIASQYSSHRSHLDEQSARQVSEGSGSTSPAAAHSPQMQPTGVTARMNAYHILTNGRPTRKTSAASFDKARAHQSLPPLPRTSSSNGQASTFSASYARMSLQPGGKNRAVSGSSASAKDVTLPEDLKKVLTVLAGGILQGHIRLATALRKRYDDQYPLVRSLADIFNSHSYILREYATYVVHLEAALRQVDEAITVVTDKHGASRRLSKRIEESDVVRLGRTLVALEEIAAEKGESGLVISLSKPFQRLLKYPLLFQNLLFNTDPSLKEYEATLAMVDEVELIVRTIEDEKSSQEEREKTRDVWARIDGLERDKACLLLLMAPKPNRLLVSETQLPGSMAKPDETIRQKKSMRRLSDLLKGAPEQHDLWVIRFSDVSLLCERTGMTNLPVSNAKKTPRSDSLPELSKGGRYSTVGRRGHSLRPRNLYRFVKIHEWHLRPKTGSTDALLNMEEISRARQASGAIQNTPGHTPSHSVSSSAPGLAPSPTKSSSTTPRRAAPQTTIPLKGDGPSPGRPVRPIRTRAPDAETDTIVSDRVSVMSFAFKSGDQVRPARQKARPSNLPTVKGSTSPRAVASGLKSPRSPTAGRTAGAATGLQRRSSSGHVSGSAANAKFAHRLRSPDLEPLGEATLRPVSRTRSSLPPAMRSPTTALIETPGVGNSAKGVKNVLNPARTPRASMSGKPAWNSGTKPLPPPTVAPVRGVRGVSTPPLSGPTRGDLGSTTTTARRGMAPSPSDTLGLWPVYREAMGSDTPKRVPAGVAAGRAPGGRI